MIVNTILIVSITSVLFVYPFNNHFRFTFGVVALSISILYFKRLPIIKAAMLSSFGIFLTRVLIDTLMRNYTILEAVLQTIPASAYYLSFGICLQLFNIRATIAIPLTTTWKLSFSDIFSNILELLIRNYFFCGPVNMMPEVAAVAIIRSLLTIYGYYLLKRYRAFVLAEEHVERYSQLILVFAELKTELYYLKKSSQDIENVMTRAMRLYSQVRLQENLDAKKTSLGIELLAVAKDIHEIKNDYYRVTGGIEHIIDISSNEPEMHIQEIFYIIEQNTIRVLDMNNKQIIIKFEYTDDLITSWHYIIVSILNNLIINAIEACPINGTISVRQQRVADRIEFSVEDNGCGINETDYEMIFTPGYSTKYSKVSGQMSTGLGLTHVKTLLEIIDGTIRVTSTPGVSTKFVFSVCYHTIISKPTKKKFA